MVNVPRSRPKRIAIAFTIATPYHELILRGIMDHARSHGRPWHFDFNPDAGAVPIETLRHWRGDGIIGLIGHARDERRAAALGIPTVNVSAGPLTPRLPAVTPDNRAVGAAVARHLLERGFRRFGYYGLGNVGFGRDRGAGFAAVVEAAGFPCSICHDEVGPQPWRWNRRLLTRWLARLEPPVGVLAVHDYRARLVLDACTALGLRVPDDVALAGVEDDALACEFCDPPLTSIPLPGVQIGRQAAALLDRLMRGKAAPAQTLLVPPGTVVARRSTDALAVPDAALAAALRHIGEHLDRPLAVDAVAAEVGLSRRSLELRFRDHLRTTPHHYLCRQRVERAKRLLLGPRKLKLHEVARACGFSDPRRMNIVFRRLEGCTPRRFRGLAQGVSLHSR